MLKPVPRQSLSDAVFAQLRDQIMSGGLAPGSKLPAERVLCEQLGVNRGAVREALRKLEQARLVSVRHGGTSRVLDFRTAAGMDLLLDLLGPGPIHGASTRDVVRAVVEMRSALAPDVARLAALRRSDETPAALREIVRAMQRAEGDLSKLQELGHAIWTRLVAASGNVAYQLAFNTLRRAYESAFDALREALADELADTAAYDALASAVARGDGAAAETHARTIVQRGEAGIAALLAHTSATPLAAGSQEGQR